MASRAPPSEEEISQVIDFAGLNPHDDRIMVIQALKVRLLPLGVLDLLTPKSRSRYDAACADFGPSMPGEWQKCRSGRHAILR